MEKGRVLSIERNISCIEDFYRSLRIDISQFSDHFRGEFKLVHKKLGFVSFSKLNLFGQNKFYY